MADAKETPEEKEARERAERIRELNERAFEASKKAGANYMAAYEDALKNMVEQQEKIAAMTPLEFSRSVTEAQEEFAREMAKYYQSAAKDAPKQ